MCIIMIRAYTNETFRHFRTAKVNSSGEMFEKKYVSLTNLQRLRSSFAKAQRESANYPKIYFRANKLVNRKTRPKFHDSLAISFGKITSVQLYSARGKSIPSSHLCRFSPNVKPNLIEIYRKSMRKNL